MPCVVKTDFDSDLEGKALIFPIKEHYEFELRNVIDLTHEKYYEFPEYCSVAGLGFHFRVSYTGQFGGHAKFSLRVVERGVFLDTTNVRFTVDSSFSVFDEISKSYPKTKCHQFQKDESEYSEIDENDILNICEFKYQAQFPQQIKVVFDFTVERRGPRDSRKEYGLRWQPKTRVTNIRKVEKLDDLLDVITRLRCMANADVQFIVGSAKINAHREILSRCSDYFSKLFDPTTPFTKVDGFHQVVVDDASPEAVEMFLSWVYGREYTFMLSESSLVSRERNLEEPPAKRSRPNEPEKSYELTKDNHGFEVLALAHKYQVPKLVTMFEEKLSHFISNNNACDYLVAAGAYDMSILKEACMKFILRDKESYEEVRKTESFKKLSMELREELIASVIDRLPSN